MRIKINFHINGFALSLALKKKLGLTRKFGEFVIIMQILTPKDSILVICVRFYEFCIMIVLFRQFDVHYGRKPLFSLLLSMFHLRDFRTILRQNFGGANKVYCGDV